MYPLFCLVVDNPYLLFTNHDGAASPEHVAPESSTLYFALSESMVQSCAFAPPSKANKQTIDVDSLKSICFLNVFIKKKGDPKIEVALCLIFAFVILRNLPNESL